jgi:hypothetical protein
MNPIHTNSHPIFPRSILILLSHLRLDILSCLFSSDIQTKILYVFLVFFSTCYMIRPSQLPLFAYSNGEEHKLWSSSCFIFLQLPVTSFHSSLRKILDLLWHFFVRNMFTGACNLLCCKKQILNYLLSLNYFFFFWKRNNVTSHIFPINYTDLFKGLPIIKFRATSHPVYYLPSWLCMVIALWIINGCLATEHRWIYMHCKNRIGYSKPHGDGKKKDFT